MKVNLHLVSEVGSHEGKSTFGSIFQYALYHPCQELIRTMIRCNLPVCHFRAWCSEMMAIITSDDLAKDVTGAETMISRHKEHRAEIDTRLKDFTKFTQTGQALIAEGHFLSDEVHWNNCHTWKPLALVTYNCHSQFLLVFS